MERIIIVIDRHAKKEITSAVWQGVVLGLLAFGLICAGLGFGWWTLVVYVPAHQ